MADAHANFAYSAVATAPSPATSGLSLVVTTGDGANFPAVPFNAVVWANGAIPLKTNAEIVRVTAISTDTLTIVRAQESSTARSIIVGDQIAAGVTVKTMTDIEAMFTPDMTQSLRTVTANQTITAGYGSIVPASLEIASGIVVEIGNDAILEIT